MHMTAAVTGCEQASIWFSDPVSQRFVRQDAGDNGTAMMALLKEKEEQQHIPQSPQSPSRRTRASQQPELGPAATAWEDTYAKRPQEWQDMETSIFSTLSKEKPLNLHDCYLHPDYDPRLDRYLAQPFVTLLCSGSAVIGQRHCLRFKSHTLTMDQLSASPSHAQ